MEEIHRINNIADSNVTQADSHIIQALIQGANHNSNCNQAAGQDVLQDQPMAEAKAQVEVLKADPSMAKEDLNKEASVANEVDLEGPLDSKLQLLDPVINSTGRRRQANVMKGATLKTMGK